MERLQKKTSQQKDVTQLHSSNRPKFNVNSLSQRKTNVKQVTEYAEEGSETMDDIIAMLYKHKALNEEGISETKNVKTYRERLINDRRYKSSMVDKI